MKDAATAEEVYLMVMNSMADRLMCSVTGNGRRGLLVPCLFLLLLGIVAYANTFDNTFQFDDRANILGSNAGRNVGSLGQLFALRGTRAVADISFALNYRLHGDAVAGYHAVNLAIHLVTSLLVLALVRLLFRTPWFAGSATDANGRLRSTAGVIAFFTPLLFALHPVQTQAVSYIVQRYTSLATLCFVAAVVLYLRSRLELRGDRREGRVRAVAYLGGVLMALLAMKTKQIALTLPAVLLCLEFLFGNGPALRRLALLLPYALTALVLPLEHLDLGAVRQQPAAIVQQVQQVTMVQTTLPRNEYLFTQFRVIATYLRLLVLPVRQSVEYSLPVYRTLTALPVLAGLTLILALIGLACYLLVCSGRAGPTDCFSRRALRLSGFGILWGFITLTVESSVIPIADIIFEHRLYLPSIGGILALVTGLVLTAERFATVRPWLPAGAVLFLGGVALGFTGLTLQRNAVWDSPVTLWQDATEKAPNSSRAWNNLAYAHLAARRPAVALPFLIRSIELDPGHPDAWNNLGVALDQLGSYKGRYRRADGMFRSRTSLKAEHGEWFAYSWNNLGLVHDYRREYDKAAAAFERALGYRPLFPEARFNLALAALALNDKSRALVQFERLRLENPTMAEELRGRLSRLY